LASNYTLSNATGSVSAQIAKREITVSGITASGKTYDGNTDATISNAGTLNNVVSGEVLGLSTVGTFESKHAGDRTVETT
ncbi:YDG domain-containing protein, partial [Acinetobacter baumannii]